MRVALIHAVALLALAAAATAQGVADAPTFAAQATPAMPEGDIAAEVAPAGTPGIPVVEDVAPADALAPLDGALETLPDLPVDARVDTPLGSLGTEPAATAPDTSAAASRSAPGLAERLGIPEQAVAPTVAAVGLAAVASLVAAARAALGFTKVVRWLPFSIPLLGLFSRIQQAEVLENPVRARVHTLIQDNPGLSLNDIRGRAGIAWGTAVHHVQRLESHGMVTSVRQGGHRRFFAANTQASRERTVVAAILHPTARRIASFVAASPGTDQSTICRALGLLAPNASKHLAALERQGLVASLRMGRARHYSATQALHGALGLVGPSAEPAPVPALATQRVASHGVAVATPMGA